MDARTGILIAELTTDPGGATAAAFSHDGARLAVAERSGTVRIWDTRQPTGTAVDAICAAVNRDLTTQEWSTYLAGRKYQRTCAR